MQSASEDFDSRISWQDPNGRESPAHCQRVCTWNPGCDGFAWSSWGCFLKRLGLDCGVISDLDSRNVISYKL